MRVALVADLRMMRITQQLDIGPITAMHSFNDFGFYTTTSEGALWQWREGNATQVESQAR